jgi:hypothetical protein
MWKYKFLCIWWSVVLLLLQECCFSDKLILLNVLLPKNFGPQLGSDIIFHVLIIKRLRHHNSRFKYLYTTHIFLYYSTSLCCSTQTFIVT